MANIPALNDLKNLKTSKLHELSYQEMGSVYLRYDELFDALFILFDSPEKETIVHYIDDLVALLYDPETMDVVGFQVEAFRKKFVLEYVEIQKAWKLSESCKEVHDLGDIILDIEQRKQKIAREVGLIASNLIKRNKTLLPV